MTFINALTGAPQQSLNLVLPDSTIVPFSIQYMDNNQGWFYSLNYKDILILNNMRLVVSPNLLRSYRNIIPFGLTLDTKDGYEALFISDFSSKRASLYLLDQADVAEIEGIIQHVS